MHLSTNKDYNCHLCSLYFSSYVTFKNKLILFFMSQETSPKTVQNKSVNCADKVSTDAPYALTEPKTVADIK